MAAGRWGFEEGEIVVIARVILFTIFENLPVCCTPKQAGGSKNPERWSKARIALTENHSTLLTTNPPSQV
jgi:hypothetical protein